METVYDWLTVAIFAGIVVLFLQRSTMDSPPDKMIHYLPPAIGCMVSNQIGNYGLEGGGIAMHVLAIAMVAGVIAYVIKVLKPRLP
jgi:hypothetical protein